MNKALFKYFATVLIVTLLFSSSVSMVILSDQMMQTTRKDMYYTVKLVENQIDYQKPLDNQVEKLNDLAYTKDTRLTIIDKDGNVIQSSLERRLMSTPLEQLKEMNNSIGVAGGSTKSEAILAALKGNYLDVLITDEATATNVLRLKNQ